MAITQVKAMINGVEHTLTYNGTSGKWEATLTAPSTSSFNNSGGYYGVSVTANDNAGNSTTVNQSHPTLGEDLQLIVKEKVAPTISIVSPGASAYISNNKPTISIQLRDSDSGVKISTFQLKIDGGTAITSGSVGVTATPVSGGYDVTYVVQNSLSDGSHTITVNVSDNDGNAASQASRTFTIDTLPPSLNVSAPGDGLVTNQATVAVQGTTNDAHSSPVSVTITLNGVDQGAVTVADASFTKNITLAEGNNTIVITATDSIGQSTQVTRTVTLDTSPPVISAVELVPNPVDAGQTYIIKVTVSG